jgi:hypothetical protein
MLVMLVERRALTKLVRPARRAAWQRINDFRVVAAPCRLCGVTHRLADVTEFRPA